MDDDDEIHSHASPATGSPPVSPRPNGRITVTVASAAPPPPPQQNSLTLALPIQQPRNGGGGGGGGGREDCWSEGATAVLIEAWGERYLELSRGNLKQKHWKEVADIVSSREDYMKTPKTDIQCKNRIDTVKKKYKLEKAKAAAGGGPSKWPFFDRLEHLIGPSSKISGTNSPNPSASASYRVPLGIPVGVRSAANQFPSDKNIKNKLPQRVFLQNQNQKQKIQIRRRDPVKEEDESEESEAEPDSPDSFPPPMGFERKRPRTQRELNTSALPVPAPARGRQGVKEKGWGNSVKELTAAILKFGETYEQAERAKLQQVMEMEKQRMKFAKELELQRMQFFMKTQLEISQLKHGRKGGKNTNHHSSNNNNNSDSSN